MKTRKVKPKPLLIIKVYTERIANVSNNHII